MPDFSKPRFNSRSSSRGGKSFGSRPQRSFEKKELFDAECNSCHKMTQVPFRPNGKKPVYCRDCFTPTTDRAPRFEKRSSAPMRREAPAAPVADPRIDEVIRKLDALTSSVDRLVAALDVTERHAALSAEVKKHMPVEAAPKKKAAPKKGTAASSRKTKS